MAISQKPGFFLTFLIFSCALFFSCEKKDGVAERRGPPKPPEKLVIGDSFYYWECSQDSTIGDALKNASEFKKLEDFSEHNLMHIFGESKHFVWIRADFELPDDFKNKPLGLVIPHLRFAAQCYCNNTFISYYGSFPPREQSTLFKAHFFSFPTEVLNQEGKNTVLLKVFVQGDSGISSHAFIWPSQFAYPTFEKLNFRTAKIYMLLFGIMGFTFILYFCLYLNLRNFKEYLNFAMMNLFTSLFLVYFFATEIPLYTTGLISHLNLAKFFFSIPGYVTIYLSTLFAVNYYGGKSHKAVSISRKLILAFQLVPTIFAPNYYVLIKISNPMMALLGLQVLIAVHELIIHIRKKETRTAALQLLLGFTPFLLGMAIDLIIRLYDNTQSYPYFFIFGWQLSIVLFILMLAQRFGSLYRKNELLSNHLKEEVSARTSELEDANYELSLLNERLEKDKSHAEQDLEMAALVQRNFFPKPNKNFRGWDVSVCYSPQSKVSGDFYDYYNYNDILNGLSLFDVSGHGLSASLVTMLSKNIISRIFQTGFRRKEPIDRVLSKVNNMILAEKGNIDNYMTGVLCRFTESEDFSSCGVELGNAGHPYPLKYSVHDNEVFELKGNDGKKHYGAIGMKGITVSFARSNFVMSTGDILVLYTDGLTEASNSKMEQFGTERIKAIVKKYHARPPSEIVGYIIDSLEEFCEYRKYDDDITLIIAKRTNVSEYIDEYIEEYAEDSVEELETLDDGDTDS